MLLVDEPRALLQDFLDRFQSLCQLELQLPSLRPEDVKNMVSSHLPSRLGAFKSPAMMPGMPAPTLTETVVRFKLETPACRVEAKLSPGGICERSDIALAFSLDIPCLVVSPGVFGSA